MTRKNSWTKKQKDDNRMLQTVFGNGFGLEKHQIKDVFVASGKNYNTALAVLRNEKTASNNKENNNLHVHGIDQSSLYYHITLGAAQFENYIDSLYEKELERHDQKKFKTFLDLKSKFCGQFEYAVRHYWIVHLFELNNGDVLKTFEALIRDKIYRCAIMQLYALRHSVKYNTELALKCYPAINLLVKKRNAHFEKLHSLKPGQLKFDLHWFTVDGAEEFAKDIIQGVYAGRSVGMNEEIHLVTGLGLHSAQSKSTIREMLLDKYRGMIRVYDKNEGILILTLPKNAGFSVASRVHIQGTYQFSFSSCSPRAVL